MSSTQGSDEAGAAPEQLAFIRETVRRAKPRTWHGAKRAEHLPVARVVVDKGVLTIDKFFDYEVPAAMADDARPGVRVRVRFGARVVKGQREGGELHDGFIVERLEKSDFPGPLAPLAQVLSPEPVLTPQLLRLCRTVADRYSRHPGGRPPAGRTAPARQGRGRALAAARPAARGTAARRLVPLPRRARLPRRAGRRMASRARSGRRCPAPAGPTRSPGRSPPRWRAGGAHWSCCRRAGRWRGSTRR